MVVAQAPPGRPSKRQSITASPTPRRVPVAAAALVLVVGGLAGASMLIGAGDTTPAQALAYLLGDDTARADQALRTVVVTLRWPRTLAAVTVGVALGVGGVLLQSATRNVLAETGLLGVNSGAALGVVVGVVATGAQTGLAYLGWALLGAFTASAAVLLIAASGRAGGSPLRLLLAGLALGMTFKGITGALLLRSATAYDQYRFWVLGSLSGVELDRVRYALPAVLCGLVLAAALIRPLSALVLGDDVARGLGHRPAAIRLGVAGAVTLLAATAVAIAGPIAFLGLLAPFAARAIAGPKTGAQAVLAALFGAAALLAADVIARLVIRPFEAPASVLVALVGAPILIWIARSPRLYTMEER